jgi:protein NrfD
MTLHALALFLLELGAGTATLLPFFPHRGPLGRGFFALHGFIVVLAAALLFLVRPVAFHPEEVGTAAVLAALYTLFARVRKHRAWRPALGAAGLLLSLQLAQAAFSLAAPGSRIWVAASSLLGGWLLGCVLLTMNLGHWYLVSRALPFDYLFHAATAYTTFAVLRGGLLAAAMLWCPNRDGLARLMSLERDALFFLFRVLWGIAGPVGLAYFVWKTARIKSNQAATGLLYVALVFVLVGELLGAYLTVATGFPV